MQELIESFSSYPVATLLILGVLLLIGAITKGGINLGFIEIPKIETGQAKLLGGLGALLTVAAILVAWEPWVHNNPPDAANDNPKTIYPGGEIVINVLGNDTDEDEDQLTVSIIESPNSGSASLLDGGKINYLSEDTGDFIITYEVSDGRGGKDTADVNIKVVDRPPTIVDIHVRVIDIFSKPKTGEYTVEFANKTLMITPNTKGEFPLAGPEHTSGKILIEAKLLSFDFDAASEMEIVEYNPIDSIVITFCEGYNKDDQIPLGEFRNRFSIAFEQLSPFPVVIEGGDSIKYGRLFCGLKIYGSNSKEYSNTDVKRELYFKFIQKNRDKTEYASTPINSGTSSNGWSSNLNKKLLRGEYELQVLSQKGEIIKFVEFEII